MWFHTIPVWPTTSLPCGTGADEVAGCVVAGVAGKGAVIVRATAYALSVVLAVSVSVPKGVVAGTTCTVPATCIAVVVEPAHHIPGIGGSTAVWPYA